MELKNLQGSNLNTVVSEILHGQGDNIAVVLRKGQFTDAEIQGIEGRVFSSNAPGSPKNIVRIIFDTGNGYEMGPELKRK